MKMQKMIGTMAAIAGIGMVGLSAAHADINPATVFPTVTASGSVFTYTYSTVVSGTETVNTGDFFTIYDFAGLVSGSEKAPTAWSYSESLTGPTATGASGAVTPIDNPSVPNVTFMYTGTTPLVGAQSLGDFSINSIYGLAKTPIAFTGRATLSGTTIKNANLTTTFGPSVAAVPEPSPLALFAMGGFGILGLMVRSRKVRRISGLTA